MWPLARPHSVVNIPAGCRRLGVPDATARPWSTWIKSHSPPVGRYVQDFSHWLEQRGFTTRTIRRCLFGATQFTAWAEAAGIAVHSLEATSLEAFCGYLTQHDQLRYASGNPTPRCMGAHHFLGYVRDTCICHAWHIHVYLKYRIMPSYYLKPSSPPEKISFACLSYLT